MTAAAARVSAAAQLSHTGLVREHNEDRTLLRPPCLAVADGVGGARGGDEAAELVIAEIEALAEDPSLEEVGEALRRANLAVLELVRSEPERIGMGSTATVAVVRTGSVEVAHVGDSRAYLIRGPQFLRMTRDHSFVNELVRIGAITAEQAASHPQRNIIVRAIGSEEPLEVDETSVPALPGDVLLLCTDGLSGQVSDERIRQIVADAPDLDSAAEALVAAANEAGGVDNVSVVLARVA